MFPMAGGLPLPAYAPSLLDTPVIPASVQPRASNPPPGAQPPSSPSISDIEVQPECFGDIQFFVLTWR